MVTIQRIRRLILQALVAVAAIVSFATFSTDAQAWHRHVYHHHFYGHHFGGWYGYGYGPYFSYRPWVPLRSAYHSSFYSPYYYSYAPVYSYRVAVPIVVAPTYYYDVPACTVPTYSVDYFSQSKSYQPTYAGNSTYVGKSASTLSPYIAHTDPRDSVNAPVPGRLVSSETVSAKKPAVSQLTSTEGIRVVKPYTPIWTESAIGLIDAMIAEGDVDTALASCHRMEKIPDSKGPGIYLRHGLFEQFLASRGGSESSSSRVLNLLNEACANGSYLEAREIGKDSITEYFANAKIDVADELEKLSKRVLDDSSNSIGDLLLLSALLKLDGQSDRAVLFANEVQNQVAGQPSFQWRKLLDSIFITIQ
jgi:hypothetical protein